MSCRIITREEEFLALELVWRELFDASDDISPFSTWEWATTWWRHYYPSLTKGGMRIRLHVLCVHAAGGQIIAIAPLYYAAPRNSSARLTSLRPIGSRLSGYQEDLTEEPVLLMRRGYEAEALTRLFEHLADRSGKSKHDYFVLRLFERAEPSKFQSRLNALKRRLLLLKEETLPSQIAVLPETWELYRRSLSKSMRDNTNYYPRLLTRRGHAWTVETLEEPDAVEQAAGDLIRLHRMRSESDRGIKHTCHIPTELQAAFLKDALKTLAARKMAAIHLLKIDGEAVAALAVLRHARTISIYYSGFDPAWYDYSPVTVLTIQALRVAMENGYDTADFLPGTFDWKERWGAASPWSMVQYSFLLARPGAFLRAAWDFGQRAVTRYDTTPT